MVGSIKKRGQKFAKKFSRVTSRAGEESKEHIKENFLSRLWRVGNIKLLVFEWSLLVVALVLLAIAQAFWFSSSYAEDVFVDGGNYIEATLGDIDSMNPLFATTNSEKVLSRLMFGTLSTIDYSGNPGIGLASSIRASEDGKVWAVRLRDGLKWSDGEDITNDDVIFTTDLIKNQKVDSIYDSNLTNVQITINENSEIVFTLPSAYADFMTALDFPILPKHILENSNPETLIENTFSTAPVTSGAFSYNALQSTSKTDEKVIYLSANPYYYGGRPMINSFGIHTYNDRESIISALNSGAVTATAELNEADRDDIKNEQFIEKTSSLNSGAFLFFNTKNESVKNVELRKAIRQGIDMNKIREQAAGTIALDYPLLQSQITLSTYPEIPGHDKEAARQKIQELLGEQKPNLTIATVNVGILPAVTNVIASELEEIGLKADVVTYEENQEFITSVISQRSYDLLVYDVELGAEPDLLPYYHSSQAVGGKLNLSNYRNYLVDDLILAARDTMDETLRVKKYEAFLDYWVNDVPAIGLYRPNLTYYYNRNVRTFSDSVRLVTALDRFTDVGNWAITKTTKNKTP